MEAPLGTRFISGDVSSREALQKGVVEDFSNFDFDYDLWSFGTPELQKVADEAREAGWVVLRSRFARGGGQFLKLFVSKKTPCSIDEVSNAPMQCPILPEVRDQSLVFKDDSDRGFANHQRELSMLYMCSSRHETTSY